MNISKFLTPVFQNYLIKKDIRNFRKSLIYFLLFRIIRNFLVEDLIIKIHNFKIYGSINKNKTSHFLLKKCEFGDLHELNIIRKLSSKNKVLFLDCGSNYGFYSFYTASLRVDNKIIAIEASKETSGDFIKNQNLNNFSNISFNNKSISDSDDHNVLFNESEKDWESSQTHNDFNLKKTSSVKSIKIDTLVENLQLSKFKIIIKLDIEGNEMRAIQGGLELINKTSPLIILEISKYIFDDEKNIKYFNDFLLNNDYLLYDTHKKKNNLDDIMKKLSNLNIRHKTIGNYYLIKNGSKNLEDFLTDE